MLISNVIYPANLDVSYWINTRALTEKTYNNNFPMIGDSIQFRQP